MYQEMSPVTEVAIYEAKQAIAKRIHSRTQNVLAQRNNFYHARADHKVVEQNAHSERDQKGPPDVMNLISDDDDDSEATLNYSDLEDAEALATRVQLDKQIPLATRVTTSASPLVVNNGTIGRLVVRGDDIADLATAAAAASSDYPRHRLESEIDVVPKTIQLLWKDLQKHKDNFGLDPPECSNRKCPFCTQSLMLQRYLLAQRLMQLEYTLYGV